MNAAARAGKLPTQSEFHEAIARRGDRWYSACLRITRDPDLAADAVQDALLSAWNKRSQFDRNARLDTWIHRIAVNAALQLIRKQKPGRFEPLEFEIEDHSSTPHGEQSDYELNEALGEALNRLSEMERVCFVLKHLEQWRLSEIASELDTNIGTIKQALFRGVRKLRVGMSGLRSAS